MLYHPRLLLGLIIYGYAIGVFSSRNLERATYDLVAFRFIAANEHPDHDTIATFRRRFLEQIEALFVQVLGVAREMGVLKLGTVALDGTKIHANASRHSALSHEHASRIEAQLKAEVADLLGKAEAADQAEVPDGMQVPEELARREKRPAEIARAKAVIEARAKERHARERAEYEAKMAARAAKAAQTGKKPGGRVPQAPVEGPLPTDQVNLTDEDLRIMPVAGGGFEQCYNAQAAVAADSLLVVAADVVQAPNDKQQLEPMLRKIAELPAELGKVGELLADNGYIPDDPHFTKSIISHRVISDSVLRHAVCANRSADLLGPVVSRRRPPGGAGRCADSVLSHGHRMASLRRGRSTAPQHNAWRTIQRSHAIANGVYVAAVNRVGHEGPPG